MNNVEILDPVRPVRPGGWKVDVSQGERNGRVSSEWFNRPDDERYLSLDALFASVKGRSERSRSRVVATADIRVEASRDSAERLHLVLPRSREPVAPTHWAFGQLASIVGAPASYQGRSTSSEHHQVRGEQLGPASLIDQFTALSRRLFDLVSFLAISLSDQDPVERVP